MTHEEVGARTLERLAKIEAELADMKSQLVAERAAGGQRGLDAHRIGERVATLEATIRHLERAVDLMNTRLSVSAMGAITGAGGSMIAVYVLLSGNM